MLSSDLYSTRRRLDVLFTPDWMGFHDPITGESWQWSSLPDERLIRALTELRDPQLDHRATGIVFDAYEGALTQPAAVKLLEELVAIGLVEHNQVGRENHERSTDTWDEKNWSDALNLHLHHLQLEMRDYSTPDGYIADFARMGQKVAASPKPPLFKSISTTQRTYLPRSCSSSQEPTTSLLQIEEERVSAELTVDTLSGLLMTVFGRTGYKDLAATGQHMTKSSPSGGARHPTEAYVIAVNVPGLQRGAYHYNVECHALDLISAGDFDELIRRNVVVMQGRAKGPLAASIVYTTIFERSMHRYRESKSYRVMHFDIGHLFGTMHLALRELGWGFFSGYALKENKVEQLLGLDGLLESAMAHTTIEMPGSRN
jgi:SagB-type dehydrogenase family enzyme